MTIAPLRFSANALIDMGGSGIRLDVSRNNGEMFPVVDDPFRGAINLRFTEVNGDRTLENILTQLVDKFIEKRLKGDNPAQRQLREVLTQEPLARTVVSTAGQIKHDEAKGFQYLTAAANMPPVMQNVDFLGAFRRILKERLNAAQLGPLLDGKSFQRKGRIVNDALAGVMALARKLEIQRGKPLDEASKHVIMLDVGSGIATGGISGNMLYTAESQNTRGLVPQHGIDETLSQLQQVLSQLQEATPENKDALQDQLTKVTGTLKTAKSQSLEDLGSMRGMTWQTLQSLKAMDPKARVHNPYYTAVRETALLREQARPESEQRFKQSKETFDLYFERTFGPELLKQAWKERWVNEGDLLFNALYNPDDAIAKHVVDGMVDALAALAAGKVMETAANKVFVQFIDMETAVERVNQRLAEVDRPPISNPLAKRVQQRMWERYLHQDIAATFFDRENGVELTDLRNTEGTAYYAEAFGKGRKNPWRIKGVPVSELRKQV